jgi:serine/threonine protein kinase/formylglycine-generating enzyme required for sulfatase activity
MASGDSARLDVLDRLAEEFVACYRRGERPSPEDFARRHPDLAEDIRDLFPALVQLEQPLRGSVGRPAAQVGGYRLLRELGRGGMGVVYEAEQLSLGRRVALKVLRLDAAREPRAVLRFRREAQAAARLHHTNIVPVFEVGQEADTAFYAMQLIPGRSLDRVIDDLRRQAPAAAAPTAVAPADPAGGVAPLLRTGGLCTHQTPRPEPARVDAGRASSVRPTAPESWVVPAGLSGGPAGRPAYYRAVARIGEQVASALAYAHARGIVHRDVKPSNLLLDPAGVVWVADFGLAKADDSDALTHPGDLVGTLRYMAPERFRGRANAGADVYALGLTLYELLALRPAFGARDRLELIEQIKDREPARPRSLDGGIPRDLETVVLKPMHKDPGRRYPSAQHLADDLRRWLAGEPVRARPVVRLERGWRWARRNPVVTSLIGSVLGLLLVIAVGAWWARGGLRARSLVETLLTANTDRVPELIHDLGPYRRWADPLLRVKAAQQGLDEGPRLHVSLALLPVDASQAEYLGNRLLAARGPEEVKVVRELLQAHAPDPATKFWAVLEDDGQERSRRLRAACALARFAGGDPRWAKVGDEVVRCLAGENVLLLRDWSELLEPVRGHLVPHQVRRLGEPDAWNFAAFLAMLRAHPEDAVVALQRQLERPAAANAGTEGQQALARQQAQAAVALLHLGRPERAWPLFRQGPDPTCRTYLIHRCAALGVDPAVLAGRLLGEEEKDPSIRQGLLLALGEYKPDQRAEVVRGPLVERLRKDYRDDPDPGVHSGVEWLLRRWGQELAGANPGPPRGDAAQPRWYVNGQGQTFAVIPAPGPFEVGSPPDERGRSRESEEDRRRVQIDYPFAVALKLVTVAEFQKFRPGFEYQKQLSPGEDAPINDVTWYEAAAYCNWLSAREKIPKDQWCYEPNARGGYDEGMKVRANYRALSGYRLPREAEWEYACRAGTVTAWAHGSDPELFGHYAWYALNANSRMHPVGTLKPNGLGLFDAHGNAWQWRHDVYDQDNNDNKGDLEINNKQFCFVRGGAFYYYAGLARSAYRIRFEPAFRGHYVGFRVARTCR